jgi:hypothetical protein
MFRAEGYNAITLPGSRVIEHDTTTCRHCQAVSFVKGTGSQMQVKVISADGLFFRYEAAHFCRNCWGWCCPRPECRKECKPFLAKLDAEEKMMRKFICE